MVSSIYTLIYSSTAIRPFSTYELEALLKAARTKNKRLDVTGLLVYADDTFFQVLEGSERVIKKLYAQILIDRRHFNVTKLAGYTFNERRYQDWTMKYHKIATPDGAGACTTPPSMRWRPSLERHRCTSSTPPRPACAGRPSLGRHRCTDCSDLHHPAQHAPTLLGKEGYKGQCFF